MTSRDTKRVELEAKLQILVGEPLTGGVRAGSTSSARGESLSTASTTPGHRGVTVVRVPRLGDLRICLDDGSFLEVLRDELLRDDPEYWRFVDIEGPHLVVGNGTFEKVG